MTGESQPETVQLKSDHLYARVPVRTTTIGRIRHLVTAWLADRPVSDKDLDSVAIIVSELVTNAIQASDPAAAPIEIAAAIDAGDIDIEVSNSARALPGDARTVGLPYHYAESGRGLSIVTSLADSVEVNTSDNRVSVHVGLRDRLDD